MNVRLLRRQNSLYGKVGLLCFLLGVLPTLSSCTRTENPRTQEKAAIRGEAVEAGQLANGVPIPPASWHGPLVQCDVLVVGGTPAGVAAALAAARRGAKVVLIEQRDSLGGDIVYAMLNMFDVPMLPNGHSPVASGIFGEFFDRLGIAFDIGKARDLCEEKIAATPNITLWKRARIRTVWKTGRRAIGGVVEATPGAPNPQLPAPAVGVTACAIVDATNDANYAARAGAHSFVGRQSGGRDSKQQSVSLLFAVRGAHWSAMRRYVRSVQKMPAANRINQEYASDVAPTTSKEVAARVTNNTPQKPIIHRLGGIDGGYIWERGDVIRNYRPHDSNIMALSINFGRQSDGTVILNTLNAVNVNGLDRDDKARAREAMRRELQFFIPYLRHAMPGLQNIELARIAPELYVRETRHVRGFYTLTVRDIREGKRFPDRVALASYPLDLHPYEKGQINPFGPKRYFYTIPLRSLVPRSIDGVFVASRCLCATYEAAGSARVIPITMAAGEACGAAATMAAREKLTPHQITRFPAHYEALQADLRANGANIGDAFPPRSVLRLKHSLPILKPTPESTLLNSVEKIPSP